MTQSKTTFKFQIVENKKVLKLLLKVDTSKASGIDDISNKILKIAAPAIYNSLTLIFNKSIEQSEFPDDLKIGKILPIFKSGERNDANNYRPISVLSCISRIFERLIYEQFYSYLVNNSLLNPRQSGFRSLHSTVTALLDLSNEWCFNIDRGMINGVIFLDLRKAFDTVDHSLLLTKLKFIGIDNRTLKWFRSYLSGRRHKSFVNGILSDEQPITCGVPQGSILGPLLFLVYINDLTTSLEFSTGRMYADDTNITFASNNLIDLEREMNKDLRNIATWLTANKLTLNILKSEYMLISSRQRIAAFGGNFKLECNGMSLSMVVKTKCLGLQIDKHLTWDSHVNSITKKVVSALVMLKRIKRLVPYKNLISVYKSTIEPYFDYCSTVWNSIGSELSSKLQRLQNRAARIITGARYTKRSKEVLSRLGWQTLKQRRLEQTAIMMFKISNKMTPNYLEEMFQRDFGSKVYDLRSSDRNYVLPKNRTDYYNKSFAFTGAKVWNSLPNDLKQITSLETFKKRLKSIDLHRICNF